MRDAAESSWSEIPYGISDLKKDAALRYSSSGRESLLHGEHLQCCIRDCGKWLARRRRGETPCFCPKHGISMSAKPTYIYRDAKRNFIIGQDFMRNVSKVERWRLGFETSEDALSWNVFVGLRALGGLAEAFESLTGTMPSAEPELYLWGNCIDADCISWPKLLEVRSRLERGMTIPTEPDIILRVEGQAVVLIEAKFGSPNSTFAKKKGRFGSVSEFLRRYGCKKGAMHPLNRAWILEQEPERILEQLCRNAVFAHWLSSEHEQPFVVNLVTRRARNDEGLFHQHLSKDGVRFRVRTWEDLYCLPVIQRQEAAVLRGYLRNKTLNLLPAFAL